MEYTEKNLYEIFSSYNAEQEGDIDIIKPKEGSKRPPLKYLKWMRGWMEVLKVDPKATYDLLPDPLEGSILHHIGNGGMVHVEVTICGHAKREWYPIEDNPMHSVPWDNITPTQVNKAIKRGLVKCLALFGLGSNLYLNDEMTEAEKDEATEDIRSLIANAESVGELLTIYSSYQSLIDSTPKVKAMFTARKNEINKTNNQPS